MASVLAGTLTVFGKDYIPQTAFKHFHQNSHIAPKCDI